MFWILPFHKYTKLITDLRFMDFFLHISKVKGHNNIITCSHYHLQCKTDSKHWPVVALDFLSIQEVLLADSDVMSGELLWLVLADGYDRVAHLQSPPVHHLSNVDVPPLWTHGLDLKKKKKKDINNQWWIVTDNIQCLCKSFKEYFRPQIIICILITPHVLCWIC